MYDEEIRARFIHIRDTYKITDASNMGKAPRDCASVNMFILLSQLALG